MLKQMTLDKVIDICCETLYHRSLCPPGELREDSFREMIRLVTSGVEFSFDGVMYRQIDGVAMGSPLGPVLANIFVGYYECQIPVSLMPPLYVRFVDDSFSYFQSEAQCLQFRDLLRKVVDGMLDFTCEFEESDRLPFLDVLVEKSIDGGVVTSVYRKPTFTGLYIVWDSFCATLYKINLLRNLVDRARRLCSSSRLEQELEKLRALFRLNGYPESVIVKYVTETSPKKNAEVSTNPVYLCLPWKGESVSRMVQRRVKSAVESNYHNVHIRFIYSTVRAFTVRKDVLPTGQLSKLIYHFECRQCESRYVGRTLQHLDARIRQHAPLHLIPQHARSTRPRRGRPAKNHPGTGWSNAAASTPSNVTSQLTRPPEKQPDQTPTCVAVTGTASTRRMTRSATAAMAATKAQTEATARVHSTSHVESDVSTAHADCSDVSSDKYESSIASHLFEHPDCCAVYSDDCFSIVSRVRSARLLNVLEAVYIHTRKPNLCKQKQIKFTLRLLGRSSKPR